MPEPIRPTFARWNKAEGHWDWGLMPEAYARVQSGYGCGYCLEPFEHWVPFCYICGEPNEIADPREIPPEWVKQG